jgi:hypothetical protein
MLELRFQPRCPRNGPLSPASHTRVDRSNHLSRQARARSCWLWPAVLGGSWQAAAEIELPYANCAGRSQLGTGVHFVSVCWHALRARDASGVSSGRLQTGGLSKAGAQVVVIRPGAPPTCCDHAKLLEPGGIKAMGGLASITARSGSSPQRLGGAMRAAVQPVAAGDRPTAALPLSAGP